MGYGYGGGNLMESGGGLTFDGVVSFFESQGMTPQAARVAAIGRHGTEAQARMELNEAGAPAPGGAAVLAVSPDVADRARQEAYQAIDESRRRNRTPTAVGRAVAFAEAAARLTLNISAADASTMVDRIRTREAGAGKSSIEFLECFARELMHAGQSGGR